MTSFNDGIEAAARLVRDQMPFAAPDQKVILSGLAREIKALKRPEPSEAEKIERVAGLSGFARFWFELGYSACYADVVVKTNCQPPFALTDTLIDRAWEIAPQAYDGDITADQIAALAAQGGEA